MLATGSGFADPFGCVEWGKNRATAKAAVNELKRNPAKSHVNPAKIPRKSLGTKSYRTSGETGHPKKNTSISCCTPKRNHRICKLRSYSVC
jgi:hypothetical protein